MARTNQSKLLKNTDSYKNDSQGSEFRELQSKEGLAELETLVVELSKANPNTKKVENITKQYGIPFETDSFLQIDRVLSFLDRKRFERFSETDK